LNLKHIFLYYHTIKYLKPIQIRYRIYYFLRKKIRLFTGFQYKAFADIRTRQIKEFTPFLVNSNSYFEKETFVFLNQKKEFRNKIDWNFPKYGKLWNYNLSYFEYLNQENIQVEEGLRLINDFIDCFSSLKDGLEAYPTSLRILNWIKFLLSNVIRDDRVNSNLYAQVKIMQDNLEYHLLGNHLLENAFALTFAGVYFDDDKLLSGAKKLLQEQLEEQILSDGAHFELSPMYHHIILHRLLDLINLYNAAGMEDYGFMEFLHEKASDMLSWSKNMRFKNGDFPHFNDSTCGIALSPDKLEQYAIFLRVKPVKIELKESGYRRFNTDKYEVVVDAGKIAADYIPGHGHNDMFNFILYVDSKPVIIDTGTSLYSGDSDRRYKERSSSSHNTVTVGGMEQAEIWGDFRVARRSFPEIIFESEDKLIIEYIHFTKKYTHRREFRFGDSIISVIDTVSAGFDAISHLHFHSDINPKIDGNIIEAGLCQIIADKNNFVKKAYLFSTGFNNLKQAVKIELEFVKTMEIMIKIH